jgi:hypothetical protein
MLRMGSRISFERLPRADLTIGTVYEGGAQPHAAADPLARLLPCGNQGGFRFKGSRSEHDYRIALVYTSGEDPDWPDSLDPETGVFTYFGDNKRPGTELHDTPRGGNEMLQFVFECVHSDPPRRHRVPPFFVFRKAGPGSRDVEFLGLAVPGGKAVEPIADLVALWRTSFGQRFQNYRALFTVLDIATVSRDWIDELLNGHRLGPHCPGPFRSWVEEGTYDALEAPRTIDFRTQKDQALDPQERQLVDAIYGHYNADPHRFEACAMEIWRMFANEAVSEITGTRPTADGGRDAVGLYSIGPAADRVHLDFSLEAKCYRPDRGAGTRDTSRLISRLRHRQFGVFVTTSYVSQQAYRELREDGHPVVVVCGKDIAELLRARGISTPAAVRDWIEKIEGQPSNP